MSVCHACGCDEEEHGGEETLDNEGGCTGCGECAGFEEEDQDEGGDEE